MPNTIDSEKFTVVIEEDAVGGPKIHCIPKGMCTKQDIDDAITDMQKVEQDDFAKLPAEKRLEIAYDRQMRFWCDMARKNGQVPNVSLIEKYVRRNIEHLDQQERWKAGTV